MQLGLDGLFNVLSGNGFTESQKVEEAIQEYEEENNPIIGFLRDAEVEGRFTKDVYMEYQVYCTDNHFTAYTLANFSKEIRKRLGLVAKQVRLGSQVVKKYVRDNSSSE